MSPLIFTRFLRVSLSLSLILSSSPFSFAGSDSIWSDRKATESSSEPMQLASLPPALRLPAPGAYAATEQSLPVSHSPRPGKKSSNLPAISSRKGNVRRVFTPSDFSKGTIVLLQDVHGHLEAQENLAGLIQDLAESDRLSKIGLEGMAGDPDLSRFHQFKDREALQTSINFLLSRGDLSGPASAAIMDERLQVFGLERLSLYQKNIHAYKEAVKIFPLLRDELQQWKLAWGEKKSRLNNPNLSDLLSSAELFQENKISLSLYIKRLSRHTPTTLAMEAFQEALAAEESLDFSQVEKERSSLLKALVDRLSRLDLEKLSRAAIESQTGLSSQAEFYHLLSRLCQTNGLSPSQFPTMDRYVSYLLLAESLDMERVYSEVREMERRAFLGAAKNEEEKSLALEQRQLFLAGKLLSFSLTPPEWDEAKDLEKIFRLNFSNPLPFLAFYKTAEDRNEALAENLIRKINNEPLGAMVVGGFHAEAIGKYLQQKNFTVLSVVPRLSTADLGDAPAALGVFLQEKTPLERIFRNEKITLAPNPLLLNRIPFTVSAKQAYAGKLEESQKSLSDLFPIEETAPATAIDVDENQVKETFINPEDPSKEIELDFSFFENGEIENLDENERTRSLTANLFGSRRPWLNAPVRLAAAGGIVIHEFGHLLFLPPMIKRSDFEFSVLFKGLFFGYPWETRGPPALGGLMANGLTAGFLGILVGAGALTPVFSFSFAGLLTYLLITNSFVLAAELFLTLFASRLYPGTLTDINGWLLGRRYIPAEKLLKSAAEEAGLAQNEIEKIFTPQRIVRNILPLIKDSGDRASYLSYRVQHNNNAGPFKGGLRYHPKLSLYMIYKLALEMSVKTSLAGLPLGGGKGGVRIDPDQHSIEELARVTRALVRGLFDARAIGPGLDVPAPDVGTNAILMKVILDEYTRQLYQSGYHKLTPGHSFNKYLVSKEKRADKWFMASQDLNYPGNGLGTPFADNIDDLLSPIDAGKAKAVITGKPPSHGGLPTREASTGRGVAKAALESALRYGLVKNPTPEKPLNGLKVSLQGFGNVGYYTALFLEEWGAAIVAVGERDGTVYNPGGIDVKALLAHRREHKDENGILQSEGFDLAGSVATKDSGVEAMFVDADIIIPAAMEDQITGENAHRVRAKIVVEGANGPVTDEADEILEEKGVVVVPDVFANAGGVTGSYYEWLYNLGALKSDNGVSLRPTDVEAIQDKLDKHMSSVFKKIADVADQKNMTLRQAAGRLVINNLSKKKPFRLPSDTHQAPEVLFIEEEKPIETPGRIFVGILRQLQADGPLDRASLFEQVSALLETAPASLDVKQASEFPRGVAGRIAALGALTKAIKENKSGFRDDLEENLQEQEIRLTPQSIREMVDTWVRVNLDRPLEELLPAGGADANEATLAAIRGDLSAEKVKKIIHSSIQYHHAEGERRGQLVFITNDKESEKAIRAEAGPGYEILTIENAFITNVYGLKELALQTIEKRLGPTGIFNKSEKVQIISSDRPNLLGLSQSSPLLNALVIQIDELLRAVEIPIRGLDALDKFERALLIHA